MATALIMATAVAAMLICMAAPHEAQQEVFDVTEFGAKADGVTDDSKAFLDAWKGACGWNGRATLLVPAGDFLLGPVVFTGPCSNGSSPAVEIRGTLKAASGFHTFGWIEFQNLHELAVSGGGTLDGRGASCWGSGHNLPTSLRLVLVNKAAVSDLTLVDGKGFHVNIHRCIGVTVRGLNITAPEHSPNTDGIHLSGSDQVTVADTSIGTGDDCISIGPGCTNVNISGVSCGPGHGISVGSLGKYQNEKPVAGLRVRNCTLTGTTNGARIKTWPGSPAGAVSDVVFEDIVVNDVFRPIIIDQNYCPDTKCTHMKPSLVQVSDVTFSRVRGTSMTEAAVTLACSPTAPCEGVQLRDIDLAYVKGSSTSLCSNAEVQLVGAQNPPGCSPAAAAAATTILPAGQIQLPSS